jgi:hypothetical protein
MHKLKTKHNIKSRDILWLNKSFGEWDKKVEEVNNIFDDQDEDEGIQEFRGDPDSPVDSEEKIPEPKLLYKMKKPQG